MRINKFLAAATGMGRRTADGELAAGTVLVNNVVATLGQQVTTADIVIYKGQVLDTSILKKTRHMTIMLHKPVGYVVSRNGQGSPTIYSLLPPACYGLKPIGRLDKNSSGLLLLTNDGQLAQELSHPSSHKLKVYEVALDAPLQPLHRQIICDHGIPLTDGLSRFEVERLHEGNEKQWRVIMHEGRNRQIRRTFAALGYTVARLHRTNFGDYKLGSLRAGAYAVCEGLPVG